eukprot:522301-Amorphochlora_amoeboformis.AAC.1
MSIHIIFECLFVEILTGIIHTSSYVCLPPGGEISRQALSRSKEEAYIFQPESNKHTKADSEPEAGPSYLRLVKLQQKEGKL